MTMLNYGKRVENRISSGKYIERNLIVTERFMWYVLILRCIIINFSEHHVSVVWLLQGSDHQIKVAKGSLQEFKMVWKEMSG